MKNLVFKSAVCLFVAVLLVNESNAQRGRSRRAAQPAAGNPTQQQTNNNQAPSNYNTMGNLPITVDSSSMSDTVVHKSLRNDNAYDKSSVSARTPLVYENLRADDALFAEKVWRELDLREKMNQPFRYEAQGDNGSEIFVDMILKAVRRGEVTAFSDDRFSQPMTVNEIEMLTVGSADTTPVYDLKDMTKITGYKVVKSSFDPKSVNKIRLKEEWVFDRESSRMFCRILGIGILKTEYIPNTTKERGTSTLFWVYYPDLRPMLAKAEVYNPKNMGQARMTWEELFESRMFASYIVKSTLDNAANRYIKNYIKDPILQLLEGDNIKEKIFNYEQDLWSY
jgi:gliding motility associated protien GldN